MTKHAAIQATFSDWRTVKGRKALQLIFEIPLEQQGEALTMLGAPMPDNPIWCAIARMSGEQPTRQEPDKPKRDWEDLSCAQQAGILCSQAEFQTFCGISPTADGADDLTASVVRDKCWVSSRKELDKNDGPKVLWRNLVADFRNWQRGVEP